MKEPILEPTVPFSRIVVSVDGQDHTRSSRCPDQWIPDISLRARHVERDISPGLVGRPGRGKLLAGDSGRKIAEVIDLQGAIYHAGGSGQANQRIKCEC